MLPKTQARVPQHTAPDVNAQIRRDTERRIAHLRQRPWEVERRLDELDREWDIERALEANAATVILVGTALAAVHDRRWAMLPAAAASFLLQHALQGWCPPLPVFRRLGYRTAGEIEDEKLALLAIRDERRAPRRTLARRIEVH